MIMGTEAESITATRNIVIIDAMVIVQKLNLLPAWVNNCFDLAKLFLERTRKSSEGYNEVHVLFDRYLEEKY